MGGSTRCSVPSNRPASSTAISGTVTSWLVPTACLGSSNPASYFGHREINLAMMRLFGGFSERVFASYSEAYPLEADVRSREGLFQLYPLLVHVVLFGGSYVHQLRRTLSSYL
ncbi:MAG: fructosamine kinase family protein [Polyangiaceae bacterium]